MQPRYMLYMCAFVYRQVYVVRYAGLLQTTSYIESCYDDMRPWKRIIDTSSPVHQQLVKLLRAIVYLCRFAVHVHDTFG